MYAKMILELLLVRYFLRAYAIERGREVCPTNQGP